MQKKTVKSDAAIKRQLEKMENIRKELLATLEERNAAKRVEIWKSLVEARKCGNIKILTDNIKLIEALECIDCTDIVFPLGTGERVITENVETTIPVAASQESGIPQNVSRGPLSPVDGAQLSNV